VNTRTFTDPTPLEPAGGVITPAGSQAAGTGNKAAAAINERRDSIARGMHSAASTLRARASWLPGRLKVARAAHVTANAMDHAANYLHDQDVRGMMADVRQVARRHPGATLLTAAAIGFLIARSISRRI
jgi:hypothetical protein